MDKNYIQLKDLEVYKLARELSKIGWEIYKDMDWHTQKIIGDQFIRSLDSVGANIAEGYARYHYLDQIKFYYNARGSLGESADHWLELLLERNLIKNETFQEMKSIADKLLLKLNNFIGSTYRAKLMETKK
jgi:four helix bundle protein